MVVLQLLQGGRRCLDCIEFTIKSV